jgi:adenylylsulfate kinase
VSWVIWITGPPGSGKSVLARATAAELEARGEPVRVLELDEIRKTLTPSPTYSDAERDVVYRAVVYMARLLAETGVPVIIDATGHRRAWRDLARAEILRFAEVQLSCPLDLCRERERTRSRGHAPRDIYAHAGRPGATVPGVDVPYESALAPELHIDTARESVAAGAGKIVELARSLAAERLSARAAAGAGWAVWITGRPGSGKTTLAEHVARAVAARGIRVKILELGTLRRLLLREQPQSPSQQEIAHRALIHAAKLLTDAGVAVIVDAAAPRRVWRDAARELIPCFAEVQLSCPTEICLERERAARWRSGGGPHPCGTLDVVPDISIVYEESLRPDLIVDTHAHEPWSAVEQVLFLIHRLRRATPSRLQ